MTEQKSIRIAYGETLVKLGEKNDKIVALDADLAHATMTATFGDKFPQRMFNMGIAEQNLMSCASGLAKSGFVPFASTFAMFGAGRAFEQVRNSIAYSNANVKIALTHSGLTVGEDGGSHQAIEDISLMRSIPNMVVIVPSDAVEAEQAIEAAAEYVGPVYLRLARPPVDVFNSPEEKFEIGKARTLIEGSQVCLIATGLMVVNALQAATELSKQGVDCTVINMHTIKPLDENSVIKAAASHEHLFTIEEHSIIGGLGSAVAETLVKNTPTRLHMIGVDDCFGESGTPDQLLDKHGLTSEKITEKVLNVIKNKE